MTVHKNSNCPFPGFVMQNSVSAFQFLGSVVPFARQVLEAEGNNTTLHE